MANGFIIHGDSRPESTNDDEKNDEKKQKNLISGRDFDDILEACRPRNVGSMPKALVSQMKIFGLVGKDRSHNSSQIEWGSLDLRALDTEVETGSEDLSLSSHSTYTHNSGNVLSTSPFSRSPTLSSIRIQQYQSIDLLSSRNGGTLFEAAKEYDKQIFKNTTANRIHSVYPKIVSSSQKNKSHNSAPGLIGQEIEKYDQKSKPNKTINKIKEQRTPSINRINNVGSFRNEDGSKSDTHHHARNLSQAVLPIGNSNPLSKSTGDRRLHAMVSQQFFETDSFCKNCILTLLQLLL